MSNSPAPKLAAVHFDKKREQYAARVSELVSAFPQYGTKSNPNVPDYGHILASVLHNTSFSEVNDGNIDAVFNALMQHAAEKYGAVPESTNNAPDDDEAAMLHPSLGEKFLPKETPPEQPKPEPKPAPVAQQAEPDSRALAPFGNRAELRELSARLARMSLPGGKKLGNEELLALAQASVSHGLDPLNGEIWIIPGSGLMIGIKGLRKKARQQVKGNFWVEFVEISDPDVKARLGIPSHALAYEARLFDTETITAYTDTVGKLLKAGIPWESVRGMCGEKPYTVGVGYAESSEKSKMTLVARAQKRAESEAIKRRFDVGFGFSVDAEEEQRPEPGQAAWTIAGDKQDEAALWSGEQP